MATLWLSWRDNAVVQKRYAELCGEVVTRTIGDPPDDDPSRAGVPVPVLGEDDG
jgi:hypothetical protein